MFDRSARRPNERIVVTGAMPRATRGWRVIRSAAAATYSQGFVTERYATDALNVLSPRLDRAPSRSRLSQSRTWLIAVAAGHAVVAPIAPTIIAPIYVAPIALMIVVPISVAPIAVAHITVASIAVSVRCAHHSRAHRALAVARPGSGFATLRQLRRNVHATRLSLPAARLEQRYSGWY